MGNNHGKNVLTDVDMEFLREHTPITKYDLAMYENFLLKHPDGTISGIAFRLFNCFMLISIRVGRALQSAKIIVAIIFQELK